MDSGLTPSDVAVLSGNSGGRNNDNGWGGDNAWWIILLFICLFGWGGNGWGNNGSGSGGGGATPYLTSAATQSDLQRGFDTQSIMTKLNGLENGLCSLGYDQLGQANNINQNISQIGYAVQNAIQTASTNNMQNAFSIQQAINAGTTAAMQNTNALQTQLADCCCENREAIMGVNYNMATQTNALQNAINQQTQDIVQNCNANYRALHDELVQSQIDAKNEKIAEQAQQIQTLNLAQSQANQNAYLLNALKPAPIPAFPAANLYGGLYGNNGCSGCSNVGTIGF